MAPKKTILLVEDNEDDALFFKRAVQKNGLPFQIQIAGNGQEAMDYMAGKGPFAEREVFPLPSFIVTDNHMPEVTGNEFLRWLETHPELSTVPTIVLCGSASPQEVADAYQHLRVHSFFLKPGSQEKLEKLVKMIFDYWSACVIPEPPKD